VFGKAVDAVAWPVEGAHYRAETAAAAVLPRSAFRLRRVPEPERDLYPHNILLTADDVFFVDWPHARLGAPLSDLIAALTSASADGIDPEPVLHRHVPTAKADAARWTAVLTAQRVS
jgi:Phosphotransferase enzyme family